MHTYTRFERFLFPRTACSRQRLERKLAGKTVLITGASSGIGEQLAYLLADVPAHLILVARRGEKLAAMQSQMEARAAKVSLYPADLRDEREMDGLLAFLGQLPKGLDVVVSNAGHSIRRPIADSLDRYHDVTRTMAINYLAPVRLLLAVLPLLIHSRGQIINVSTVNALLLPLTHWAAYQASKSAFDTWLRSAAPELHACDVRTTTIYLPLVRTPMIEPTAAYRNMPAMSPRHAAELIGQAMYTKRRVYKPWWLIFGQLASVVFRPLWEYGAARKLRPKGRRS